MNGEKIVENLLGKKELYIKKREIEAKDDYTSEKYLEKKYPTKKLKKDKYSDSYENRCKKCGRLLDETEYVLCERCEKTHFPKYKR